MNSAFGVEITAAQAVAVFNRLPAAALNNVLRAHRLGVQEYAEVSFVFK